MLSRIGLLVTLALASGCATANVRAVPRATDLAILLNQPISSETSWPGQPFTATVRRAVHAPDGSLLIAPGALVYGTVVEARTGGRPRLGLSFDAVDTTHGRARLHAELVDAGRAARIDSGMVRYASPGEYAMLYPYPYSTAYAYQYQYGVAPRAVALPAAAPLTLRMYELPLR